MDIFQISIVGGIKITSHIHKEMIMTKEKLRIEMKLSRSGEVNVLLHSKKKQVV